MRHFTVSQTASLLTRTTGEIILPHTLSNLLYKRLLDATRCPIVGRCRMIPIDYLSTVERVLRNRGLIRQGWETGCPSRNDSRPGSESSSGATE